MKIAVIIPALNEEKAIAKVIREIPKNVVNQIVVADNGSTDKTAEVAKKLGITVVFEPNRGYGNACLAGMEYLAKSPPDIVVFLDGDYSVYPEEIPKLIQPIIDGRADFVIGSRPLGKIEKGALPFHAILGNWLATKLMRLLYHFKFTDPGPFRAIKWKTLLDLKMREKTYGWNVEMMLKAVRKNYRIVEIPSNYRKRIGKSKITGTARGTLAAGSYIIFTIIRYALRK